MKALCPLLPLVLSVAVFTRASAELVTNGSFEAPVVPVGSFTNFGAGSTAITGWTVVGVDSAVVSSTFHQSGITFNAKTGVQWLDLAGVTSNSSASGVTQSIATTVGRTYTVSFYVGSAQGGGLFFPATVDLSINGGSRVSYFNPAAPSTMLDWKLFTVPFTATGTTTNLRFLNGSASFNFNSALDSVSVLETQTLSGSVNLNGYVGSAPGSATLPLTFTLLNPTTLAVLQGPTTVNVTPSGGIASYSIPVNAGISGTVEVVCQGASWLKRKVLGTVGATNVNLNLVNGNTNGDTVIDLTDYTILATAFNGIYGNAPYDGAADMNKDGVVDLTDYTILAINFNAIDD